VISPDTIERIRERVRLSEIVGKSVRLERRGRSLLGLCPFHKEKSPSFHVHDDRGFFHCFGCQASGDVFKFIMETEGLSFHEAATSLGEKVGISVELDMSSDEQKQRQARRKREQELYHINEAAAAFFERMLLEHPSSRHARAELEARGLKDDEATRAALKAFRIGYAPSGWDELGTELARLGLRLQNAESVGLLVPRSQGSGYYDRFRHRLMFAILDVQGRIVGFSGRALAGLDVGKSATPPAKYVNSPETPIYKKRDTVFGLYQSRQALRDNAPCVVVEGNFDVVSLHARGVVRAVAPLGTAFTVEQARQIRRFTSEVIFLFDADTAGKNAVKKARDPCQAADLRARVGTLPEGKDPDDFSRAQGREGVELVLTRARGMLDYLVADVLEGSVAADDSAAWAAKIREVGELIRAEQDPTVRALAEQQVVQLAARMGIADRARFGELERAVRRVTHDPERSPNVQGAARVKPAAAQTRGTQRLVEQVLGAFLDFPELLDGPELEPFEGAFSGDLALSVAVLRRLLEERGRSTNFHETLAKIPEPLRPFVSARLAAPEHEDLTLARRQLMQNLKKILGLEHSKMAQETTREIERARLEGDLAQEMELLRDLERRARMRQGI